MTERFRDKKLILPDFSDEFHFVCPECRHKMISMNNTETYESVLSCTHCTFRLKTDNRTVEIRLKANCNNCGEQIDYFNSADKALDSLIIRCERCLAVRRFTPKINEYRSFRKLLESYSLWYSEDFRGNLFWAYNDRHLEYMEAYIKAGLRERKNRAYFSLVERLPKFIQSAKNRNDLLKLIHKMKHP